MVQLQNIEEDELESWFYQDAAICILGGYCPSPGTPLGRGYYEKIQVSEVRKAGKHRKSHFLFWIALNYWDAGHFCEWCNFFVDEIIVFVQFNAGNRIVRSETVWGAWQCLICIFVCMTNGQQGHIDLIGTLQRTRHCQYLNKFRCLFSLVIFFICTKNFCGRESREWEDQGYWRFALMSWFDPVSKSSPSMNNDSRCCTAQSSGRPTRRSFMECPCTPSARPVKRGYPNADWSAPWTMIEQAKEMLRDSYFLIRW